MKVHSRSMVLVVLGILLMAMNVMAASPTPDAAAADAGGWTAMPSGTTQDLHNVWGSSASNVFAVGQSGTILHYSGN